MIHGITHRCGHAHGDQLANADALAHYRVKTFLDEMNSQRRRIANARDVIIL